MRKYTEEQQYNNKIAFIIINIKRKTKKKNINGGIENKTFLKSACTTLKNSRDFLKLSKGIGKKNQTEIQKIYLSKAKIRERRMKK